MTHLEILKTLNNTFAANFYLVGGFVRDMLSGVKSEDYDIATDLEPEKLIEIARQNNIVAIPTGLKHGTVTVLLDNKTLEITTFRKDFKNNGRHCSVEFSKSIKEDSLRRDFTINAIYLDVNGKIYDFHSGQVDLGKNRVHFIGDANTRINEDYLRMLRFFRFFADFDSGAISMRDTKLQKALNSNAHKITELSADRISQEFIRLAHSKNYAKGFAAMASVETLADIFNLKLKTLNAKDTSLTAIYPDFTKLAFLYRNNLNDLLENSNFNWSNKQKKFIKSLISAKNINLEDQNLIKNAVIYSKDVIEFWLVASYLDASLIKIELLELLDLLNSPLPEFKVTGADLIALGYIADKNLGLALKQVKQYWLAHSFANKQACLDFASNNLKNIL